MKMTQNIRNVMYSLGIAFLLLIIVFGEDIYAQDYQKVIEVVQKMEGNLKEQISNEQKERKLEIAELREQIYLLQKGIVHEDTKEHSVEIKEQEKIPGIKELALLKAGNERYVTGSFAKKNYDSDRAATLKAQHPYAIVLTCADSRVPPELIFDESIGKLFVVRDAGNLVDSVILGTIEYAAEHLHVELLLILGHESCGAVTATVNGGEVPPNIGSLVSRMKTPIESIKAKHSKDEKLVSMCVEENVRYQIEQSIAQSGVLAELVEKGELEIVGGVYDIGSGKVRFLNSPVHAPLLEKKETSHEH